MKIRISQIDYMTKNKDQFALMSLEKQMISPFSIEILDSVMANKNMIVFSQGDLNLTPLLTSSYSLKNDSDIVVFLPESEFDKRYRRYTVDFFSLLYKKKYDPFHSFFFYNDILWCEGKFNDKKELINLEIEKTPIHGDLQFKRKYRSLMTENFRTNRISTTKEIVFVPIGKSFPLRILGEKNIQYEGFKSKLDFNPKFYLIESINKTFYDFEVIEALLKRCKKEGINFLLHFSWPYLPGLKPFLDRVKLDPNPPKVMHLGKRICFELKDKFEKPESFALGLSLEGDLWDRQYYPDRIIMNSRIIIPINSVHNFKTIPELEDYESQIDNILAQFNTIPNESHDSGFINSIISFPPALDTIVLPVDIKDFDRTISRYIPLQDLIEKKIGKDTFAFVLFNGICDEIQKAKNLAYNIRGIQTNSPVRKFTLFQMLILNTIGEKIYKKSSCFEDNIIIVNQFPGLSTSTGLKEHLNYLVTTLNSALEKIELPTLRLSRGLCELNSRYNSFKIWQDGQFVLFDHKLMASDCSVKSESPDLTIKLTKKGLNLQIDFLLDMSVRYTQVDDHKNSNTLDSHLWEGIPVISIVVFKNGSYELKRLKYISLENEEEIRYKWLFDSNRKVELIEDVLEVKYLLPAKIKQLSTQEIRTTTLLVAGPVPFTTFSHGEVYITKGFDVLFMPFKEIIFLAYPGRNFRHLKKQLTLFKEIISSTSSVCSIKDLEFSIKNSDSLLMKRLVSPQSLNLTPSINSKIEIGNGPSEINEVILTELLDESKSDSVDQQEIRKIKEIVDSIKRNHGNFTEKQIELMDPTNSKGEELVKFKVAFDDGTIDEISFHPTKLLRRKDKNDFVLAPAYTFSNGDEILYIQTSSRESIDEFVLKMFDENDTDLIEQVFEPLICLNLFYNALSSIPNQAGIEKSRPFKELYWLTIQEKQLIYNLIKSLLDKNSLIANVEEMMTDNENNIWYKIINAKELKHIVTINKCRITYETLYDIIRYIGFSLAESTFEAYCKAEIRQHYYFRDSDNLLYIGKLIGNKDIVKNYKRINESGERIAVSLRMIGHSISRVVSGNYDELNEMDALIEGSIRKCKILSKLN